MDTTDSAVWASVSIGKISEYAFGLSGALDVSLPNTPADLKQQVVDLAHDTCPFSNATKGNMEVVITIVA